MNHPPTTQALARIHQAELLKEAELNRLLREEQTARLSPAHQWLTSAPFLAATAAVLFLLVG